MGVKKLVWPQEQCSCGPKSCERLVAPAGGCSDATLFSVARACPSACFLIRPELTLIHQRLALKLRLLGIDLSSASGDNFPVLAGAQHEVESSVRSGAKMKACLPLWHSRFM